MFLDPVEFSTFLLLQQNPLVSISNIAEKLDITFYRANKAFESLFERKLIKGISSTISPSKLNLKRIEILYEIEEYSELLKLEEILELHNYTRYHTRFISGLKKGIYAQFDLPARCIEFLRELSTQLKTNGIVDKFKFLDKGRVLATSGIDIRNINWQSLDWNFKLEEWFEAEINYTNCREKENIERDPIDPKINNIDLWIMRSLSKNSLLSNKEVLEDIRIETKKLLGRSLDKDLSTISRRLKFVKENLIADSQLLINNKLFNLSTQIMFDVDISKTDATILCLKMQESPLPFKSTLTETKTGFRWFIRCPSDYISDLTNYIWKLKPSRMNVIYLIPSSKLYWFYPLNYDLQKNKWKDSYEHFFDPIKEIL